MQLAVVTSDPAGVAVQCDRHHESLPHRRLCRRSFQPFIPAVRPRHSVRPCIRAVHFRSPRTEAIIDIANEGSKGLLLKLGFTYEGNLRQRYPLSGQFLDEHYFGLLKHEWNA